MGFNVGIITNPVNRIIGLSAWSIAFALMLGAVNGWYLQSVDAGIVDSERFDRVVIAGTNDSADAWEAVTAVEETGVVGTATALDTATAYTLYDSSGACSISGVAATGVTAAKVYTPLGTKVSATAEGKISGCNYESGTTVFNAGGLGGLASVILQACGLAAPIVLMFELGKLGQNFVSNFSENAILSAVLTVVVFLMVATLLNTFVPFLTQAFTAVDGNRFVMFDEGLGTIAIVIRNFWGIVLVGSLLGVAWSALGSMRGRGPNQLSARQM